MYLFNLIGVGTMTLSEDLDSATAIKTKIIKDRYCTENIRISIKVFYNKINVPNQEIIYSFTLK